MNKEIDEIKTKIEKPLKPVYIVNIKNGEGEYSNRGFTFWHSHKTYTIDNSNCRLTVTDSPGGCGMQQLYGWSHIANKEMAQLLLQEYFKTKHGGVGLVICQVGQGYYTSPFVKVLIENGFEVISEYNNLQHGLGYTQRIYAKKF